MKICKITTLLALLVVTFVTAIAVPNAWADLLVLSGHSVKRYSETTGAFIDTFVPSTAGVSLLDMTFGPDGNLYISAQIGNSWSGVKRYNGMTGAFIDNFAVLPLRSSTLADAVRGLTFGPDGNLYVTALGTKTIKRFNGATGELMGDFVTALSLGLSHPFRLRFGPDGKLYVITQTSGQPDQIMRFNGTNGGFEASFPPGGEAALDLVFGRDGNLYVSNQNATAPTAARVSRINPTTGARIDFVPLGSEGLLNPRGLAFGPDGNLYASSGPGWTSPGAVKRYQGTTGEFLGDFVATGSGGLTDPGSLTFTPRPTNRPPTVTCPAPASYECQQGGAEVTLTAEVNDPDGDLLRVEWFVDGVSVLVQDNVASGHVSLTHQFSMGTHSVALTVSDGRGGSDSCSTTVTVADTTPPVIICVGNVTVNTDEGQCYATVTLPTPQVSDNCEVESLTNDAPPDGRFPCGTTVVTWTLTDAAGNQATCQQLVTVEDHEAPTIVCPPDITVNTDPGQCYASGVELGNPLVSDNCGIASVANDAPADGRYPVGTTAVTWTVTDTSGNVARCAQTVTVEDQEPPSVSCSVAKNMLLHFDHKLENVGLQVNASDNCGAPVTQVFVFGDEDDEEPTGDGTHSPDAKDIAAGTLRLRAERKGNADGRVYLIVVIAMDSSGNVGFHCCTVVVPKNKSQADIDAVNAQAARAVGLCPEFAAFALGIGPLPSGYFIVGDGAIIGPKQ